MTARQQPTGRGPDDRARLASALKQGRATAGLSGAEAGRRAGMSQSKVSKIERSFLLPSPSDVAALCGVYGIPVEELVAIATGLREEQSARVILARGIGEMQRRIRQLEGSATVLRGYQPTMVLGLLQTPAYSRCVFDQPVPSTTEDQVEEAVGERRARQTVLDDPSKDVRLVLTEGALRWQAGSPTLMADQIDHILSVLDRPNLRLGIIPWTTSVRLFPRHGFHVFDADAVIVGTETATATITGAADVATYLELFAALEDAAEYDDEARQHFERIRAEYKALAAERDTNRA